MRKLLASILILSFSIVLVHAQGTPGTGSKLEANWRLTGTGEKLPPDYFEKVKVQLVIKNGNYDQIVQGKKIESGTFKFDTTKTPATIDFAIREGGDKGKIQLGIFKLDGDKLTMAVGKAGSNVRPKNFEAKDDVDVTFFKRGK